MCQRLVFICFMLLACSNALIVQADTSTVKSLDTILSEFDPPGFADDVQGIKRTIDLNIGFEINSATLTKTGKAQVAVLGEAMLEPRLKYYIFFLIGHTDASGESEHNYELSNLRAKAVKNYLVEHVGVPRSQLLTLGAGESELIEGLPANSPKHRRVQIVAEDFSSWYEQFLSLGGTQEDIEDMPQDPKAKSKGPVQINW